MSDDMNAFKTLLGRLPKPAREILGIVCIFFSLLAITLYMRLFI